MSLYAQNIQVDSQTFSAQQLIEDILIDSDCISNVQVTNVVGGDFGGADQSYGFFDATGTTFPFQSGLVMSTGRLQNVPGPNASLSDDDAPNWTGDNDLEVILNESNTINATILEFDFTAVASQVSFRYLFASEEYQEGNPNTCQFSDLFGFLIRPANQTQYTNIALVPDTQTPVKVTTVHPGIPGGCEAQNEFYFESFNGTNVPINFNGQTKVLTATANIVPNQPYHVKLVIADEQNFRFDSAVFLEAGSLQLSTDLGPNRLLSTYNAVCEGDTVTLNAFQQGASYIWSVDGVPQSQVPCLNCSEFEVSQPGTYSVEVFLDNNCMSFGDVIIEYAERPDVVNATMTECDTNSDGLSFFNLFDAESVIVDNDTSLNLVNFFLTEDDAINNSDPISNADNFQNTIPSQIVYARVINQSNCSSIAELQLETSNNNIVVPDLNACDENEIDGITTFDLREIEASIQFQIPGNAEVAYYGTEEDAFSEQNELSLDYQNTIPFSEIIYIKVENSGQCFAIAQVQLNVLYTPQLLPDESVVYCLNTFPDTIELIGGVLNDSPSNYYYEWLFNGSSTAVNTSFNNVSEAGVYTVIVTDPNGCSSQRTIEVTASNIATIDDVTIEEVSTNNTITVAVSGEGFYEYALDDPDGFYQEENTFTNVSAGFHTVYVRDRNGCGITEKLVSVLGFPKFFTPNGDIYNPLWKPKGVNEAFNVGISIDIFDRYGKLISRINHLSPGWDGTLNGRPLPGSDYWFVATLLDGRTYTGHFALKR